MSNTSAPNPPDAAFAFTEPTADEPTKNQLAPDDAPPLVKLCALIERLEPIHKLLASEAADSSP